MNYYYNCEETTKWFMSFFQNRKQFVQIGQQKSPIIENHNISCIQGSSAGPETYSLYTADIESTTNLFSIYFADDTNIINSGKDLKKIESEMNEGLETIQDYLRANKLTLNVDKTVAMHFKPPRTNKTDQQPNLEINQEKITLVKETKFLGVTIDNKLKYDTHFKHVVEKVKKGINALKAVKNLLDYSSKIKIYYALIHSHLTYCPLVWLLNQPKKNLTWLAILQKKAIRLVFNAPFNCHTEKLFKYSQIVKVTNVCETDALTIMYRHHNKLLSPAISNLIIEAQKVNRPHRKTKDNISNIYKNGDITFYLIKTWTNFLNKIKYTRVSIDMAKDEIKKHVALNSRNYCTIKKCERCKAEILFFQKHSNSFSKKSQ